MTGSISGVCWMLHGLQLVAHELLLFAAFWFVIGLADELAIDLSFIWLRLVWKRCTAHLPAGYGAAPLAWPAPAALFRSAGIERACNAFGKQASSDVCAANIRNIFSKANPAHSARWDRTSDAVACSGSAFTAACGAV